MSYANRHGKNAALEVGELDAAPADYFSSERRDFEKSLQALRRSFDDLKAGRTRPACEFLEELREKHGFPHEI